jgi:hypothetical protein
MARLKFLLFALPALGIWAWLLASLSVRTAELAAQQAEHAAASARPAFQARQAEEQLRLQWLLARGAATWSTTPHAGSRSPLRGEALLDAFTALRASVKTGLRDEVKSALVLGLSSGDSTLLARGEGAPSETLDGFTAKEAFAANPEGLITDAFGTPHEFYALALTTWEKDATILLVGAPLVSVDITSSVEKETGLAAVALVRGTKVLTSSGPQQEVLKKLAASPAPAKGPLSVREPIKHVGPLGLPWGPSGPPVRFVGVRAPLAGSNVEVMGLASTDPQMHVLADGQQVGAFALLGLFVLGVVMLALLGGQPAPGMSVVKPGKRKTTEPPAKSQGPAPLPVMDGPAPAEAHPDDFPFPSGSPPPEPALGAAPTAEEVPAHQTNGAEEFARQQRSMDQTRAEGYRVGGEDEFSGSEEPSASAEGEGEPGFAEAESVPSNGAEGYEASAPPEGPPPNPFEESEQPTTIAYPAEYAAPAEEENPDATRVAEVPAELIQQSAGLESPPPWQSESQEPPPPPAIPQPEMSAEETHFQAVFREFVTTRERCGESADGLTYDRFAQKLRKNRDQLVQKYSCRTVRFQVYVKEGKAALKATPIRDG